MKTELEKSIQTLCKHLANDEGYRIGWKANIAMVIKDELEKDEYRKGGVWPFDKIANNAADRFIKLLTADFSNQ